MSALSKPLENACLRVLSLGAGVQSTTLALMAARGEVGPMPDAAIFADTGWEPEAIYRHLDWLESVLPFPVYRVRRKGPDLGEHAIEIATAPVVRTASPPWFTKDPAGMLPKQCSKEYKVRVIEAKVREMLGIAPKARGPKTRVVEQWIGISRDEITRMKDSDKVYTQNRWPLIEASMTRRDCLAWMAERQYPTPAKSSCIFCPYRGDEQWRRMRAEAPEDWTRAVAFDRQIRPGFYGMTGTAYVHRSLVPLDEVDLRTPQERGQGDLFDEECDAVCGV